ncbi:uncharacterized protein K452DRAFT_142870 [Aplosporella prunicola CBS 121167]|uniref:Uncharacterized protein n=1 Tax=Aplosporella prunicola CBS 121167 TaxID=1176127 RepID=A0A6A6BNS6_9PEZI|nr:uncharacterized protein K452DRAFT_142870 [Aplosporella prunicola CBS 121167]KAF2144497.1 hypothetical protein K452DRAFT_142870 [Aplosporella prunicola CBS 121167]
MSLPATRPPLHPSTVQYTISVSNYRAFAIAIIHLHHPSHASPFPHQNPTNRPPSHFFIHPLSHRLHQRPAPPISVCPSLGRAARGGWAGGRRERASASAKNKAGRKQERRPDSQKRSSSSSIAKQGPPPPSHRPVRAGKCRNKKIWGWLAGSLTPANIEPDRPASHLVVQRGTSNASAKHDQRAPGLSPRKQGGDAQSLLVGVRVRRDGPLGVG